jgi:hypothetical protein
MTSMLLRDTTLEYQVWRHLKYDCEKCVKQMKLLSQRWTNSLGGNMRDGWWVDRKNTFPLGSSSLANHSTQISTVRAYPSMYHYWYCCFHQLHNSCTALANNWCCCWSMQNNQILHHPQRENVSHNSSLSLSISHIHSIHDPSPPCVTQSQGCIGKLSFEPLGLWWWSQLVT